MSAVLGPLLLDQLPKSKPVTPVFSYLVSPRASPGPSLHCLFTLPCQRTQANLDSLGQPGTGGQGRSAGNTLPATRAATATATATAPVSGPGRSAGSWPPPARRTPAATR